jgi:hypothetical protein
MKPRLLILLLVLALCAGTIGILYRAGCYQIPPSLLPEWGHRSTFPTAYADETTWILTLTARDIAEMGAVAGRHPQDIGRMHFRIRPIAASAGTPAGRIRVIGWKTWIKHDVAPSFIWQPDLFQGLAADCLHGATSAAGAADPQGGAAMLHTLLDLQPAVLAAENRRVSAALNQAPADPESHEEAALLLGAFALREHAGDFSDVRKVLCRITAHLALAQALHPGQPFGPCGKMADLTLRALAGRETDVLAVADSPALDQASPDERVWLQALALHVTHDWRRATPEAASPFLLRMECFYAAAQSVGPDYAIRRVLQSEEPPNSAWTHVVLENSFTVENGHAFGPSSTALECKDLLTVWQAQQWPVTKETLVAVLNQPEPLDVTPGAAGAGPTLEVLGPGTWAAFFQRHLCQESLRTWSWMKFQWGVPEEADAYWAKAAEIFGGLSRWPTVVLRRQDELHDAALDPAALAWIGSHPEEVPLGLLVRMISPGHDPLRQKIAATYQAFYATLEAPGSAERIGCRIDAAIDWAPQLVNEAAYKYALGLNPSDFTTRFYAGRARLHAQVEHFTPAQVREAFGPLLAYNLDAMMWLATACAEGDPAGYEEVMARECLVDPDKYLALGLYYAEHGETEKAAAAYQHGFDEGSDRVSVSVKMDWLITHYLDIGNPEAAEKIAKDVAEVYSYGGLETMVHFQERTGHLPEAEDYAKKIKERYNNAEVLRDFYIRHAQEYPEPYATELAAAFPHGLRKFAAPDAAPARGVRLLADTPATRHAGFRKGDIILALDGYAVEDVKQYTFVRALSFAPGMAFVVWRDQGCVPLTATIPSRKMGVTIKDYTR